MFIDLFELWVKARVRDPSLFLTDFGSAKKLVEAKVVQVATRTGVIGNARRLKNIWDSIELDDRKVTKFMG
jgi:hypothetical protein